MTERRRIQIFERELSLWDVNGRTLPDFLAAIDALVHDVPVNERHGINFEVGGDEDSATLNFCCYRDETDIEAAKRIQAADDALATRMRRDQDRERALYETLKRKFEP